MSVDGIVAATKCARTEARGPLSVDSRQIARACGEGVGVSRHAHGGGEGIGCRCSVKGACDVGVSSKEKRTFVCGCQQRKRDQRDREESRRREGPGVVRCVWSAQLFRPAACQTGNQPEDAMGRRLTPTVGVAGVERRVGSSREGRRVPKAGLMQVRSEGGVG